LKLLAGRAAAGGAAAAALAELVPLAGWSWPLELVCHFQVQILLGAVGCAAVLALLHRWWWLAVAMVGACAGAASVLPYEVLGPAAHAGGEVREAGHLRILLSNVLASNRDHDRVRRVAQESGADVLVMQEFDGRWQRDLADLKDRYPYTLATRPSDAMGMAVYSRIPIESFDTLVLGGAGRPTFVLRLDLDGRKFSMVCTHPRQPLPPAGFELRNDQLEQVGRLLAGLPAPVILVGDLNTTMWSPWFKRLCERSGLESVRRGRGVLASWPAFLPALMRVPIDHVLVSPDVTVTACQLGPPVGSDHLPLIVDLLLP
jgi:endonuclease/exonuclease/phosphatase (EEP) superfamily protein YafD